MGPIEMSTKQAIADAWEQYIAETDDARRKWDTRIKAAEHERQVTMAHLHAQHQLGVDDAWHLYHDTYSAAWADYEAETKEARLIRDDLVYQNTQREITTTAEQVFAFRPEGDDSQ